MGQGGCDIFATHICPSKNAVKKCQKWRWKKGLFPPKSGEGVENCGEEAVFRGDGVTFDSYFRLISLPLKISSLFHVKQGEQS